MSDIWWLKGHYHSQIKIYKKELLCNLCRKTKLSLHNKTSTINRFLTSIWQFSPHGSIIHKVKSYHTYHLAIYCFYKLRNSTHHWGPLGIKVTNQSATIHQADKSLKALGWSELYVWGLTGRPLYNARGPSVVCTISYIINVPLICNLTYCA